MTFIASAESKSRSRPQARLAAGDPIAVARSRMERLGLWRAGQHMGRRWATGCVALEVTQRCNLDCTLCYLSESSQALKDVPIEELFRRLGIIRERFGPGTDVQITGGEPTLRPAGELAAIVRRALALGLRPALFTNGILATRALLASLCEAGLEEVAFHVDRTQLRKGYRTEEDLNALRAEYIARARGLPLALYFNTTVFDDNLDEIADVVRFFLRQADAVRLASFQLQAETGRGVLGGRGVRLGKQAVIDRIRRGAGAPLNFDAFDIGHPRCNRYAMALVANGRAHELLDDVALARRVLQATAELRIERTAPVRVVAAIACALLRHPGTLAGGAIWLVRKLWRMRTDLLASRGRVHKLSFFIHDFMDACALDNERVEACSFLVATGEEPLSMCLHNARRELHLLKPVALQRAQAVRWWDPVSGSLHAAPPRVAAPALGRKTARGRAKRRLQAAP
jgi:organic radical activating enzyme